MGYYDYSYGYPAVESAVWNAAGFVLGVVLVVYLLAMIFCVVSYVLYSLGLYRISKRRGIHNAWLSWLPIGNLWILGSISDQYQYVAKGCVRNRRKTLLGLSVALGALLVFLGVGLVISLVGQVTGAAAVGLGAGLLLSVLAYLVSAVLAIILVIFTYIALYDLYVSCDPGNAVMYIILSILLSVVLPFFLFACRNKDLGMPPRRAVQPAQPAFEAQPPAGEEDPVDRSEETKE